MKVDTMLGAGLASAGADAAEAQAAGFSGAWTGELSHEPFFPLLLAAEHTETIELGTSIAVAFARNPMLLASAANDLQTHSRGRFVLGLGTQVRSHITRRYSMPWSHPAARMREMVQAIRAIWDCWNGGSPLRFEGEFYTHTVMPPFFDPGPNDFGPPRIFLAGVGPRMTEVAGEVADGFICHSFTTERYLREVTLPALGAGRRKIGKRLDGFEIQVPPLIATGADDAEREAALAAARRQIGLYGATPGYRGVLDLHGWGSLQDQLLVASRAGEWDRLGELVSDEVLDAFAVVGDSERVGDELRHRFGDCVQRISLHALDDPHRMHPWVPLVRRLQAGKVE